MIGINARNNKVIGQLKTNEIIMPTPIFKKIKVKVF